MNSTRHRDEAAVLISHFHPVSLFSTTDNATERKDIKNTKINLLWIENLLTQTLLQGRSLGVPTPPPTLSSSSQAENLGKIDALWGYSSHKALKFSYAHQRN